MRRKDLNAIVGLSDETSITDLKRLALLFDRIDFRPPVDVLSVDTSLFLDEELFEPAHAEQVVSDFEYFRHHNQYMPCSKPNLAVDDLVAEFEANDVMRNIGPGILLPQSRIEQFRYFQDLNVWANLRKSGPKPWSGEFSITFRGVSRDGQTEGPPIEAMASREPADVSASVNVATTLFQAECMGGYPVFSDASSRHELEAQYDLCRRGLEELRKIAPEQFSIDGFAAKLSELSFTLLRNLISSTDLDHLTATDIIRFREETHEMRQRYVNTDLAEISELVEGGPMDDAMRLDVAKYIRGKLQKDLDTYERKLQEIVSKYRRARAVATTDFVMGGLRGALIGTAGSGLLGTVLPHSLLWGAALGALIEGSRLASNFQKVWNDKQTEKQSLASTSIAYVAALKEGPKLQKGRRHYRAR